MATSPSHPQYNSVLGHELEANDIAQVTANLASVASLGQTIVNLFITPALLQHLGVGAALLVTPIAYVFGEGLVLSSQTVATVFACRLMDFTFRYTISDNTKQILYKGVPAHQLIEARAFIDGSIKKLAPMLLGAILILCQKFANSAFALVLPIGYAALVSSCGLMPLVLRLARMVEAPTAGAGASSMV